MIARFSLYGFLKNQRYFEPFLLLALLDCDLSFLAIGLLFALRELVVNLLEIPSGAIADLYGRKNALILSFSSYLLGFTALGVARDIQFLAPAMVLLGIGDAFRSGTHKAMIFSWLKRQNRTNEKTRVYGYTRSWSKLGSALSALVAAIYVGITDQYSGVFFLSALPCFLSILNIASYPKELNHAAITQPRWTDVYSHTKSTLSESYRNRGLRRLFFESMGFEGFINASKDYLQPIVQVSAALLFLTTWPNAWTKTQQSAALIGPVYFFTFLGSAFASRHAATFAKRFDSELSAARALWLLFFLVFLGFTATTFFNIPAIAGLCLVSLQIIQNFWRPIMVSRIDEHCADEQKVTVLSIESQARKGSTLIFAPLIGFLVDTVQTAGLGGMAFWPIGALGVGIASIFSLSSRQSRPQTVSEVEIQQDQ